MSDGTIVVVPPTEPATPSPVIAAPDSSAVTELAAQVEELVEVKKDENITLILGGLASLGDQIKTAFDSIFGVLVDIRAATVEIEEEISEVVKETEVVGDDSVIVESIPDEAPLSTDEIEAVEQVTQRSRHKTYFV